MTTQTLSSGFSLKCHALLCRAYAKGRDWYDFIWYVSRQVRPVLELLGHALDQQGPWAGQSPDVTGAWLIESLRHRVRTVDWQTARRDIQRFLPAIEQPGLELWGGEFFLQVVDQLAGNLDVRAPDP